MPLTLVLLKLSRNKSSAKAILTSRIVLFTFHNYVVETEVVNISEFCCQYMGLYGSETDKPSFVPWNKALVHQCLNAVTSLEVRSIPNCKQTCFASCTPWTTTLSDHVVAHVEARHHSSAHHPFSQIIEPCVQFRSHNVFFLESRVRALQPASERRSFNKVPPWQSIELTRISSWHFLINTRGVFNSF